MIWALRKFRDRLRYSEGEGYVAPAASEKHG